MDLIVRTFLTSKQGEALEDCEDSIHPEPGQNPEPGQSADRAFAVSDGTSTSFFSGLWARILTRRFAADPRAAFESAWPDWLRAAQQEWQEKIRQRAEASDASFYTRNEFLGRKPAAATFVGLVLEPQRPGGGIPWRALVLGDSCLFLLGKDGHRCLELQRAEQFSNIVRAAESYACESPHPPKTYGSGPPGMGVEPIEGSAEPIKGSAELLEGDAVLLATDAFSKWLLLRAEQDRPVWTSVLALTDDGEFAKLVEDARREAEAPLENDDVALGIIKIGTGALHERYLGCRFEPQPKAEKPAAPGSGAGWVGPAKGEPSRDEAPVKPRKGISGRWARWRDPRALALGGLLLVLGLGAGLAWQMVRAGGAEAALLAASGAEVRLRERLRRVEAEAQTEAQILRQQLLAKTGEMEMLRHRSESAENSQRQEIEGLEAELAKAEEAERNRAEELKQAEKIAVERAQEAQKAKEQLAELAAGNESLKKKIAENEKKISEAEKEIEALKEQPPAASPPPPDKAPEPAESLAGQGGPPEASAGLPSRNAKPRSRAGRGPAAGTAA